MKNVGNQIATMKTMVRTRPGVTHDLYARLNFNSELGPSDVIPLLDLGRFDHPGLYPIEWNW